MSRWTHCRRGLNCFMASLFHLIYDIFIFYIWNLIISLYLISDLLLGGWPWMLTCSFHSHRRWKNCDLNWCCCQQHFLFPLMQWYLSMILTPKENICENDCPLLCQLLLFSTPLLNHHRCEWSWISMLTATRADQQFSVVLYQEVELPFWKLYISLLQCYAIELQHVGILVVNCIDFIFSTIYGLLWWRSSKKSDDSQLLIENNHPRHSI